MMNAIEGAIAIGLFVLGALLGYGLTASHYQAQLSALKIAQDNAIASAQAHVITVVQSQDKVSQGVVNDYEQKAVLLAKRYSGVPVRSLLNKPSYGPSLPTASQSASAPVAASSDAVPAGQCAQTTLMLSELQNWVRQQGMQ